MTQFATRVAGIPCRIAVTHYQDYRPGNYFEPPDELEFEFAVLDQRGRRARWLEAKLDDGDHSRLLDEFRSLDGGVA